MTAPRSFLRAFLRDCRGAAAAEMALMFPMVGFIVFNVIDFATFAYSKMQVELAAQQAVGTARTLCTDPAADCYLTNKTAIDAAAQATTLGAKVTLAGSPQQGWYCATGGALTAVAQSDACKPGRYVHATTSFPYKPIFPGVSVASALTSPIKATAWMRLP
ncbi:MAG: pilus assembly protein [Novosphingobium sp.]|jgi:Flp pilus assembly protein TadG|nr:pilus assembly protein [Novosphingobium sp.]